MRRVTSPTAGMVYRKKMGEKLRSSQKMLLKNVAAVNSR